MKNHGVVVICSALAVLLAPWSDAVADELPRPDARPLSTIIETVEGQQLGSVTQAEFDDGLWQVDVCNSGACQTLYFDPSTGDENRREDDDDDSDEMPPTGSMPVATIARSVESQGLGVIKEIEFDDGSWEVDVRRDGRKIELSIDPMNGQVRQ